MIRGAQTMGEFKDLGPRPTVKDVAEAIMATHTCLDEHRRETRDSLDEIRTSVDTLTTCIEEKLKVQDATASDNFKLLLGGQTLLQKAFGLEAEQIAKRKNEGKNQKPLRTVGMMSTWAFMLRVGGVIVAALTAWEWTGRLLPGMWPKIVALVMTLNQLIIGGGHG